MCASCYRQVSYQKSPSPTLSLPLCFTSCKEEAGVGVAHLICLLGWHLPLLTGTCSRPLSSGHPGLPVGSGVPNQVRKREGCVNMELGEGKETTVSN